MPLQTRGDAVAIPESNQVVISSSVDILDDDGFNIGFLQQINRTDNRPTQPIRHLDAVDGGRVIEQAPGPETNTLNATGFAIYNTGVDRRSLLNRITGVGGARFRSLNSQQLPFELTERWIHPATNLAGETLYGDCWLTNYSRPVNIGTIAIAETANITASWVE